MKRWLYTVTYAPQVVDRVCADITINYQVSGESRVFIHQACGGLPEQLAVVGEGFYIEPDDNTPMLEDLTDFGL